MLTTSLNLLAVLSVVVLQVAEVAAVPSPQPFQARAFTVPLTPHKLNGRDGLPAPPMRHMQDSDGLGTISVQERGTQQGGSQQGETESIPLNLKTSAGWAYTVDVTVGGTRVPLKLDTSASLTWVAHTSCQQCAATGMGSVDTPLPDDCGQPGVQQNLTYMQGWVVGCIVNNTIELDDSKLDQHPILAVTATSGTLSPYGFYSGHIGLAGDNVPLNKGPTIVSALYQSGQIPSGEVGLFLPRFDNITQAEMTFGDPASSPHADTSKAATIQSVEDVPFKYDYMVEFDSFKVGGQEIASNNRTFLNTASTGISFPASLTETIFSSLGWSSTDTDQGKAPCSPTIPDPFIVISFGGQEFVVQYQDLVSKKADGSDECWAMISPSRAMDFDGGWSVFAETWIIGSPLFHNVYHSVDTQSGTVKMFGVKQ